MSCRMTVFAAVRLMPRPPARVDRINMKMLSSWLNWSMSTCLKGEMMMAKKQPRGEMAHSAYLSCTGVEPSNLRYLYPLILR